MRSRVVLAIVLLLALYVTSARAVVPARRAPRVEVAPRPPAAGRVLVADDAGQLELGPAGELRAHRGVLGGVLAATLARHGLARGTSLWRSPAASAPRFLRLESSQPDFDPDRAAAELRATGLVRAAVPDVDVRLHVVPNDTYYADQWYAQGGTGVDVRLPTAWDVEQGSPSVRIGVMDTGVDLGHPDLASKIWTNTGEIPANGLDDDDNGYIDDVHGWDFGDGDNDPNPHAVPDPEVFDVDVGFHGTFVSGIAAAATNNAEGIAGAGWNCSIVPLKVVDSAAEITLAAMTEAFGYATAMQLEVLNMSLGTPDQPGVAEYFQALVDAATAAGVLCVASAGNSGTAALNFPAACSGVLSVAATDELNDRASFSNYGPTVRIAAPGTTMWSSICRNYLIDDFSQLFYEVFFFWDAVNPYMYGDGTSFSAPLVAGACALVRSRHPGLTPLAVAAHMVATGDVVAYDQPIGPRLNVYRAVTEPVLGVDPAPVALWSLAVSPNPASADALIRFSLPTEGSARLRVYDLAGRLLRELAGGKLPAGPHTLSWDGADKHGRPASAGIYIVRLDTPGGVLLRKLVRTR